MKITEISVSGFVPGEVTYSTIRADRVTVLPKIVFPADLPDGEYRLVDLGDGQLRPEQDGQ